MIAAVIIVVVQGVVGTVVALADAGPTSSAAPSGSDAAEGARGADGSGADDAEESKEPAPGVPVSDGDVEFVLRSVRCGLLAVPEETAEYEADGRFCLVMVTARNRGDAVFRLDLGQQRAYQSDGTEFEPDAEVTEAASAPAFLDDIAPGGSATGALVFDLPVGEKIDEVQLRASETTGGARIPF